MHDLQSMTQERPALAYFVTAVAAVAATVVCAFWSAAGDAPSSAPTGSARPGSTSVAASCTACHGVDGNRLDSSVRKTAGGPWPLLVLHLRKHQSGERPHAVIATVTQPLSDREIRLAAKRYVEQRSMWHDKPFDPAQRSEAK